MTKKIIFITMTKQELIKYLHTQNCYEFLYTSYTDHTDINIVLPSVIAVVGNLRRIERTQVDEQVTAVWHFPSIDAYVKFEGEQSSYDGTECTNLYLVEPEEYTAVRFNKFVEILFTPRQLCVDIEHALQTKYDLEDSIIAIPYITSVNLIEQYDRDEYGAEAYRIFEVTIDNGEKHIVRIDGYYSSYSGFEVETVKIVKPVEKTVIVYE